MTHVCHCPECPLDKAGKLTRRYRMRVSFYNNPRAEPGMFHPFLRVKRKDINLVGRDTRREPEIERDKQGWANLMFVEFTKSSKGSSDGSPAEASPDFFCRFSCRILFLRCVEKPSCTGGRRHMPTSMALNRETAFCARGGIFFFPRRA